ncbi:MAG: LytTR family DNA-binding domain-containing protein [Saprospiraceae bacterium]
MKKYPAICLSLGNDFKFVYPSDIMYIKSEGSYSNIYFKDKENLIVTKNLKNLEEVLPEELFIRIHHSTIINLIFVNKYHHNTTNNIELLDGTLLLLARRKKALFLKRFIKI